MSLPRAAWPLALGGMLVLGYIGPGAAIAGLAVLFVATVVLTTRAIIAVHRRPKPLPPPSLFPSWDEYLDRLAADDTVTMDRLIEAAERRATGAEPPGWEPPVASLLPSSSKVRVDASNPAWERPATNTRPILMTGGMTYQPISHSRGMQMYEANLRAIKREQYHPVGIRRCGHYPARRVMTPVTDPETGEWLGDVDCCPSCYEDVNGEPPPPPLARYRGVDEPPDPPSLVLRTPRYHDRIPPDFDG